MVSPCLGGLNLPWTQRCSPHPGAANVDGVVLAAARRRKERTYPEFSGRRSRARLVVLAGEIGGRLSKETRSFLSFLAKAKARSEPPNHEETGGASVEIAMRRHSGLHCSPRFCSIFAGVQVRWRH